MSAIRCRVCHDPASHHLMVGDEDVGAILCCTCADALMADIAATVPADGWRRWQADHAAECGEVAS